MSHQLRQKFIAFKARKAEIMSLCSRDKLDFILKLMQKETQRRGQSGGCSVCHFSRGRTHGSPALLQPRVLHVLLMEGSISPGSRDRLPSRAGSRQVTKRPHSPALQAARAPPSQPGGAPRRAGGRAKFQLHSLT